MAQTLEEIVKLQLGHLTLQLAIKDMEMQVAREKIASLEAAVEPTEAEEE